MSRRVDGTATAVAAVAVVAIAAGGLVAAVNSAAPFEHGSWLAAYLVLVGGLSQLGLALGPLALPAPRCSRRLRRAQLLLWNVGIGTVAVGVFTDLSGLVLAGSAIVLAALACFAYGAGHGRRLGVVVYRLAVGALGVSVVVGAYLAEALPGS